MNIGVFGGTFDPLTCAHYEIVKRALAEKHVDKVIVIPTIVDYYRKDKTELFDLSSRRQIIERWFKDVDNVILDFHEYDLATDPRRYYDDPAEINSRRYLHMLEDVIKRHNLTNDFRVWSIIGGDSWNNLETWYEWKKLVELTEFIVVVRNNEKLKDICNPLFESNPPPLYYTKMWIDDKFGKISASAIRKRLEDEMSSMSLGPCATYLDLYLEDDVDEYLKTRKTHEERHQEYLELERKLNDSIHHIVNDDNDCSFTSNDMLDEYDKIKKEFEAKSKNDMTLASEDELVVHTPIFDVLKCQEVEAGFRPVKVKAPDWVSVVVEKDEKFLMVKQLRYGLNKEFEEFPCGMVESKEDAIDAGLRELEEETGIKLRDKRSVHYLGKFAANPAFMTNYMHYLHVNLDYALYDEVEKNLDPHEHLSSSWVKKNEAFDTFMKSEGSSIMGSAWMLLMKNHIV